MEIHRLTTSGPALAAFLQEAALLRGAFDGLLIGTTAVRTESVVHDTRDDVQRQLLEVHIATFCCCDSLGSFYNEAGEVEAEEVEAIANGSEGQVLGWFVHQYGTNRPPSMRERAVTAALAQVVPDDVPVIFASMSAYLDQERATISFDQQFLTQEPGTVILRPVEISIENIGSSARARDYQPLRPVSAFAPDRLGVSVAESGSTVSGDRQRAEEGGGSSSSSAFAAENILAQTDELEKMYHGLLASLEESAERTTSEQADLKALQYEVEACMLAENVPL